MVLVPTLQSAHAPPAGRLLNGTSSRFNATVVEGRHSHDVPERAVRWSSSNPSAATIDREGRVSAKAPRFGDHFGGYEDKWLGSTPLAISTALPPVFPVPPASTFVGALIVPTVQVRMTDDLGGTLGGLPLTMAIGVGACRPPTAVEADVCSPAESRGARVDQRIRSLFSTVASSRRACVAPKPTFMFDAIGQK